MYENDDDNDDDLLTEMDMAKVEKTEPDSRTNERETADRREEQRTEQADRRQEQHMEQADRRQEQHMEQAERQEEDHMEQADRRGEQHMEPLDADMVANMTDYESVDIVQDSRMLLQAARSRNTKLVSQILQKCPELKTDLQDEVGKTALHYLCCTNNTEDIRMCAQKGNDINMTDNMGWTPLHYASMRGNKDVVEALVGMGANCNIPDTQSKRTPLHVAVSKNHMNIVNLLLLSGADPTMKDKDGKSVKDVCKNDNMGDLIDDAVDTFETTEAGDIEKMQIEPNRTVPFINFGITVKHVTDTNQSGSDATTRKPFMMTLLRIKNVGDLTKYGLQETEDLCSDEFEVKLRTKNEKEIAVELGIDVIMAPTSSEELVFKTDSGQEILIIDTRINEENQKCRGIVSVDILSFKSFVVVSRPKQEKFEVGADASTLTSAVDDRVELDIAAGTFGKKVTISMEITDLPSADVLKDVLDQSPDLTSTSAFYSFEAENMDFAKPIGVKIPLPPNYTGNGHLVILSMDKPSQEEKPEYWNPIEAEPTIINNRVEFVVSSFSHKVAVETPRPLSRQSSTVSSASSFGSLVSLRSQLSKVYRRGKWKEFKVKFFCVTRRQGTSNTFKVVTECCREDRVNARTAYWEGEGFKLQGSTGDLDNTTPISVYAKDKFSLQTTGLSIENSEENTLIEYHPKRENNYNEVTVKISDRDKLTKGSIQLFKKVGSSASTSGDLEEEKVFDVGLVLYKFHPDMLKEMDGKSFLTYNRMALIQNELGDRWWKVILLLDIPFTKLEKTLQSGSQDLQEKINLLLFDWRESVRREKSRGVPVLLSALCRCNRAGLVRKLRTQLVKWKDEPQNKTDGFYGWLEKAYEHDLILPIRRPKPMSDPFLAMVADLVKPSTELEESLGLNNVPMNDRVYPTPGLKTMKILTSLRANVSGSKAQMSRLVDGLKHRKLMEPRDYTIMWTKAWVECAERSDDDQRDVEDLRQFLKEQVA